MSLFPPTIIIRHCKENLKKCSLSGLESRSDLLFFSYPLKKELPDLSNYVVLGFDGPELSMQDYDKGLIIIDGTWKYAAKMQTQINQLQTLSSRSLPSYKTGYPRKQTLCPHPELGLASVEALFIAHSILQRNTKNLLDKYFFKKSFFSKNFFY